MVGHIFVYGEIGTGQGQVSQKYVKSQIDKNAESYVVHIFSPGGDVFEGYGIYNAIKNDTLGKQVETHIEGLCASIATLIAAAGQKIIMNKTGQFMVHNPSITDLKGDADKIRAAADQLDQIKSILINVYEKKTGLSKEKLWELYDNETYLTADQAVQMGFIDESVDAIKAVAKLDLNNFKMEKKKLSFLAQLKNLFAEFKNLALTLADGTVIEVLTEDGELPGKQVVTADGNALADGEHPLADGRAITVSGGVITEVKEAEAPADKQQNEEMDNKIKELETQLAEAKAAKEAALATAEAAKSEAASATAKVSKFENKMADFEKKYLALMEAAGKTIGDTSEPPKGPVLKNLNNQTQRDPMGEEALKYYKHRNMIPNEED